MITILGLTKLYFCHLRIFGPLLRIKSQKITGRAVPEKIKKILLLVYICTPGQASGGSGVDRGGERGECPPPPVTGK